MDFKKEFRHYAVKDRHIGGHHVDRHIEGVENMTRSVIEERPRHFREIDVFSRLMMDRIIFLGTEIDDQVANVIVAQLLFMESSDPGKDVLLYINSPGGGVYPGLGIYDTMQYIGSDVGTVCVGMACSMGAVLLAGGKAGKRTALPHARIMIHQPMGGARGQASDLEITVKQVQELKKDLYHILAQHTGKSVKTVEKDADRDHWMKAAQAQAYGMIDRVLASSNS